MYKISSGLTNCQCQVEDLIMKATSNIDKYEKSSYKFENEYTLALIEYTEKVFEMIVNGVAIDIGINPDDLQKSQRVPFLDLIKMANNEEGNEYLIYKSLFSRLKSKLKWLPSFLKQFKFNKGQVLEPLRFNGMIKYNPKTKRPLTNLEWAKINKQITEFLGDKLKGVDEEMVVKGAMFGKLIQSMQKEGMKESAIKSMSYKEMEDKYGTIPSTIPEATKKYNLKKEEQYQMKYAKDHAAKYLAMTDGKIKNSIVSSTRDVITNGLKNGDSPEKVASVLYHVSKGDDPKLTNPYAGNEAWNRDFRRISFTEIKAARENGKMTAALSEEPEKKHYFIFDGSYNPKEKPNESCNKYLGDICLLVDEPMDNDNVSKKDDQYAKYYIWPGKDNVGRTLANQWVAIPMHPHCTHHFQPVNPARQYWDDRLKKIRIKRKKDI